jgi:hypothetical protein
MKSTYAICLDAAKRALVRAYEEGTHRNFSLIESNDFGAEGVYRVGESIYLVTLAGCNCKGGQAKMICKHCVALADLTGKLETYIPGVYTA